MAARRPSTVRQAATSACPITCPPNTRCQPDLRAPAPEKIDLELLEVEDCEEVGDGAGHQGFRTARNAGMWTGACKPVKLGAEPAG